MQAALTRLWGPAYQSVAAGDILGEKSNAYRFDEERGGDYRREAIGRGLASAILLGSFGGQGGKSGFSSKDLKLACSREGLNWNYTDGALLELENRCFYLHTTSAGSLGKRSCFGTKPTLNKLVVQYRQQNAGRDFDEEILEDLRNESLPDRQAGLRRGSGLRGCGGPVGGVAEICINAPAGAAPAGASRPKLVFRHESLMEPPSISDFRFRIVD